MREEEKLNKQREEEKGVYPNGTAMFKTDTNPKALGFGEEEKEIERALAGGKMYQIREVKKLLDKALSSQLKEVEERIFQDVNIPAEVCKYIREKILAEVERLV